MRRRPSAILAVIVAIVSVLLSSAAPASASTVTARNLLLQLPVRAANYSGYSRTLFSNGNWIDADHDCQNTRAEVLLAESRSAVTFTTASHCYVKSGSWYSWYDGKTWTLASAVQIDHVVPVAEAWASGARSWTSAVRTRYYNDLSYPWNLDAVTSSVNLAKGDRDPAHWLPPLASARCGYAIHWVAIKYRWRLSIDPTERATLLSLLSGTCGTKLLTLPARGF